MANTFILNIYLKVKRLVGEAEDWNALIFGKRTVFADFNHWKEILKLLQSQDKLILFEKTLSFFIVEAFPSDYKMILE